MPQADNARTVMTTAPELALDKVCVSYNGHPAIRDASLSVRRGEILALVGPSGCGKSTLLATLNRMTDLTPGCKVEGRISIDGADVRQLPVHDLRQRVGMVFQKPNPFPLSIRENLGFPLREHGVHSRNERDRRIEAALRQVGLWDEVADRLDRPATRLSGGQQQRLCLARALVLKPSVLLLDEPCSALDPISANTVEQCIAGLRGRYTTVIVTHNLAQARRLADTMAVFWVENGAGRIIETGPTRQVFEAPVHPLARAYCQGEAG